MTQPNIATEGGAYAAGEVKTGRDFIGRDVNITGIAPDEFTRLLTQVQREKDEAIRAMREAIEGKDTLKSVLSAGQSTWQATYSHIDRIGFAKEVHDMLQRLALAYNPLHLMLFEHNSLRATSEWRWPTVRSSCTALKPGLRNLMKTITERQLDADPRESWAKELKQCSADLESALTNQDADLLDMGLSALREVLNTQPTRYNARLGESVDAMDAPRLFRTLNDMANSIAALRTSGSPSVDVFLGYVVVIHRQVHDLTQLRNVHHSWQDVEDRLQMEYAQLYGDVNRFRLQWRRRLVQRLQEVIELDTVDQSIDVQSCCTALEASFANGNLIEVREALWNLRSAVSQRFNEVDHDFRRLCSALDKNSRPLGETIAGLN